MMQCYYQINKTVIDSDLYKECESVQYVSCTYVSPAYNNQDEDPIPLDQVEFD